MASDLLPKLALLPVVEMVLQNRTHGLVLTIRVAPVTVLIRLALKEAVIDINTKPVILKTTRRIDFARPWKLLP